jgi:hypothetical protein
MCVAGTEQVNIWRIWVYSKVYIDRHIFTTVHIQVYSLICMYEYMYTSSQLYIYNSKHLYIPLHIRTFMYTVQCTALYA